MSILPGRPGHPRRYHNVMMVELVKELLLMMVLLFMYVCVWHGSLNCSILPSRMGEHGESWENMENMENTENMEIGKCGKHHPDAVGNDKLMMAIMMIKMIIMMTPVIKKSRRKVIIGP